MLVVLYEGLPTVLLVLRIIHYYALSHQFVRIEAILATKIQKKLQYFEIRNLIAKLRSPVNMKTF